MKKFSFYGASDDLFMMSIDGIDKEEIYPPHQYVIEDEQGQRIVINAHYGIRCGVWSIGVEPFDEAEQIPAWKVDLDLSENKYSAVLNINTPDDVTYRVINKNYE